MLMARDLIEIIQKFMLLCNIKYIECFLFIYFLFDKLKIFRKKEALEKEIVMIEKDLEKLNSNNVIIDLTKW